MDPMSDGKDAEMPDAASASDGGAGATGAVGGAGGSGGSGGASPGLDSGLPPSGSGGTGDSGMDAAMHVDGGGPVADAGRDGGADADAACPPMTFGASCTPVTCEHGTCNQGTCSGPTGNGACDACDDGWIGPNCNWTTCEPYAVEPCYDGPEGTQHEGICRAGTRVCHQSGSQWSICMDQRTPRVEDICGNDLDDNCSGDQADEVCDGSGQAVWVDAENGNDTEGDGSYAAPFATLNRGVETGQKLIVVVADEDGTVYEEDLALDSGRGGNYSELTFLGWGPTRPTLVGTIYLFRSFDVAFENLELAYPDPADYDPVPRATVRGSHNYRGVWRNVRFSAPYGLPARKSLYTTHHGYDDLFVDVEVDDVVLAPGADSTAYTYSLLNADDFGLGSQFTRVTLGSISLSGVKPESLSLQLIRSSFGHCGRPSGAVTAVRNALITGLDMSAMATTTTRFQAIELGCITTVEEPAGFMVLNNTFADITATSVTFAKLELAEDLDTWISGNIVGPHAAGAVTGLTSNRAATIDHSDFYEVTTPVDGMASLGSNMLDADPGFVGAGDYHLDSESACIDTGDPQLTDSDGTRSDMGAYGGPLAP